MATRTRTQSLYNNILVLVFLLLARTGCDWVEISQNHYRKEPPRQITDNSNYEETTEAIIVYRNSSLLDKHWKKGVIDRVPSVANIKRVHIPSVKTPSKQTENNIFTKQSSSHINLSHGRYDSVIEKPNIVSKYHEEEIPIDPSERFEVPYHINRESSFVRNSEVSFHKAHISNTNIVSRTESFNKGYITNVKKENWDQDVGPIKSTYMKGSQNIGIVSTEPTPQTKYQNQSEVDFNYEGGTGVIKEQPKLTKYSTSKGFSNIMKPIVQALPMNNAMVAKTKTFIKKSEINSQDKTREANSTNYDNQHESDNNRESIEYESNEDSIINSDGISNNTKGGTMTAMWKLIKVVTDSIYKSTRKSFRRKINYLESLKSNILSSIEDQVERTWPDADARGSRRARDASGRGHVEFPSSESALMSISFLTFAVFLIKLVLQVIHTYKNKTMMVTPAVVTAVGRAAAAIKSNQQ